MTLTMPRRPHIWLLSALGLMALLGVTYACIPIAWRHYEHRRGLEGREMFTRTKQGIPGDPINVGLVATQEQIFCAFGAAGWFPASPVTMATSLKIVGSVALRRPYPAAPVSALFYDGRQEDLAFEKAGGASAKTRHHVRFWRTASGPDESHDPRPLWLGSASFDRGVGVSHYTLRATHHIDPDLDTERAFLGQALASTGLATMQYEVSGIGPTLAGRNGGGDRYFTDGEVVVDTLSPTCKAATDHAPTHLPNPWWVHVKNRIWIGVRTVMRLLPDPNES